MSRRDAPLQDVTWRWLQRAIQFREFRYWKGQKHYPGLYWSSTMRAHVGYESRLELWSALGADFDPHVCFQLSQPFELSEGTGTRRRYHVPDYLLRYDDGRLCVVDVKPASKLAKPKVQAQFAWTRRALKSRGWEYRVESEPDDTYLQNLRFLAGYRQGTVQEHRLLRVEGVLLLDLHVYDRALELALPCPHLRSAAPGDPLQVDVVPGVLDRGRVSAVAQQVDRGGLARAGTARHDVPTGGLCGPRLLDAGHDLTLHPVPLQGMVDCRWRYEMAHGYVDNKPALLARLSRAEGQVRGIARMIDEDVYCIDVLTQVSAATKALESVALALLEDHLAHCVAQATAEGGPVAEEKLREANAAIARLVRS